MPNAAIADETAATELALYIENDGDLYRQQGQPILKNLANKAAQGKYNHAKAVKLYMYLMESGAKKYVKEFGSGGEGEWHRMFSVATRKEAADAFASNFGAEYRTGAYDGYLTGVSARKKAAGASNLTNVKKSASQIEAQNKERASWYRRGKKDGDIGREPIFQATPTGVDAISIEARPTYISETAAGRAYLRGYGKRAYLRDTNETNVVNGDVRIWVSPNGVEHTIVRGRCATCGKPHPTNGSDFGKTMHDANKFASIIRENDIVRIKGVKPSSAEYDIGKVTLIQGTAAHVSWKGARASYWEELHLLEKVPGASSAAWRRKHGIR